MYRILLTSILATQINNIYLSQRIIKAFRRYQNEKNIKKIKTSFASPEGPEGLA